MTGIVVHLFLKYASISAVVLLSLYIALLLLLTTSFFQTHIVYLHKIQMTWFKDLDVPEQFGFLRGQTTPFAIRSPTAGMLYAWHILPLGLYRQHEPALAAEPPGFAPDIMSRLAFNLLRDDPDAHLVIHLHGAAGTVGSGYRVPNYRALAAGHPKTLHILTIDYRGFGRSKGTPSEDGLCLDGIAVVDWAMNVAGIPPSRILIFGQSLGTAVSLAISEHFALQSPPVVFAGTVLVAPFIDVATLVATYRIAGIIPILSPLVRFPVLFKYLSTLVQDKWSSTDRIAGYVQANEANGKKYRLTLIHAEDDFDIPSYHTELLFLHAVNATIPPANVHGELEAVGARSERNIGAAGSIAEWHTQNGVIRREILKTGLHDAIMSYPVITLAVMRIFEAADLSSG